ALPRASRRFRCAVPWVSFTPTPGRLANCFLMRSRRSSHLGWNAAGMRLCQLGRSPPCPSASMTCVPKRPMSTPSVRPADVEDAARQPTAFQVVKRAVELVEGIAVGDQLVDAQPPRQVEIGQHREVATRAGGAVAAAQDALVVVEAVDHGLPAGANGAQG